MEVHMVEDCWETPAFLRNRAAQFTPFDGTGNLYIISPDEVVKHDLNIVDLSILSPGAGSARYQVQEAELIGPFSNTPLPASAISHHITAPASVFQEYASKVELRTHEDLFPSPDHDPIYKALLSMPWIKIDTPASEVDIKAYIRFLEIPDYYDTFEKRLPPEIAFYDGFSIHDAFVEHNEPFLNPVFVDIEDMPYFGPSHSKLTEFTETANLLDQWDTVVFEMDLIAPRPDMEGGKNCSKGLVVQRIDDETVQIADLTITFTGMRMMGFGAEMGWHYKLEKDGTISRAQSPDDCPCGNELRHQFHLEAFRRIEEAMQRYGITRVSDRLFEQNRP